MAEDLTPVNGPQPAPSGATDVIAPEMITDEKNW